VAKDYEMCVAHIMNTSQILKIPYIVLIALKKTFTPLATYIEQNKVGISFYVFHIYCQ